MNPLLQILKDLLQITSETSYLLLNYFLVVLLQSYKKIKTKHLFMLTINNA